MCFASNHRSHDSNEIPEVADKLRLRIDDDGKQIQSSIEAVTKHSAQLEHRVTEFLQKVENLKTEVRAVGEEVKRSIDRQINEVFMKLESVMSESAKQAESAQEAYQLALLSLESFHTYSRELLDKGRPSDITRAACELHDRATELLNNDVTAVRYCLPHVIFTPADVTQMKGLNLIGKVTITTGKRPGRLQ